MSKERYYVDGKLGGKLIAPEASGTKQLAMGA